MNIITLTPDNLDQEHICCAISSNKDPQVASKKAWLAKRFNEGLVFKKGDVRGKCFIEYIPAEYAWVPLEAPQYIYINCLWVSGQFKGQGWSNALLDECIADARKQGKHGICILSSQGKKRSYLADPKYLLYKGFELADTAEPFFALYYLPLNEQAEVPRFKDHLENSFDQANEYTLFYTAQCPFTAKYVPLLEEIAHEQGINLETVHLDTREAAQAAPCPTTTYALFHKGEFVTNEILSEKKFLALVEKNKS